LVEVDTRQVIVEAIKRAEDSDAVVVRLYEAWGRSCTARIETSTRHSNAHLCDLLERDGEEVHTDGTTLELDFTPFQVATLKLGQ
jgi:alpha-mannosidase